MPNKTIGFRLPPGLAATLRELCHGGDYSPGEVIGGLLRWAAADPDARWRAGLERRRSGRPRKDRQASPQRKTA